MMDAYEAAKRYAASARRQGYPDAEAMQAYCLNWQRDGNWVTYTVSIHLGEYKPETMSRLRRWIEGIPNDPR